MAINIWTVGNRYSYRTKLIWGKQHKTEIITFKLLSENISKDRPECSSVRDMEHRLDAMYVTQVILQIQAGIFSSHSSTQIKIIKKL